MSNYQDLDAWKVSMKLVKEVYELLKSYPREETFGLIAQTKRASVSIPANIAEGMGRRHKKDCLQFLYIARGSIYELETLLNVAFMVEIIGKEAFQLIMQTVEKSLQVLNGLINYIQKSSLK